MSDKCRKRSILSDGADLRRRRFSNMAITTSCLSSGLGTKHAPWLAPLKQHRAQVIICIKQFHRRVAAPEAQSLNFMCAFHVGHCEFQEGRSSIRANDRGNPGAGYVGMNKRRAEAQGPAMRLVPPTWPASWRATFSVQGTVC